MTEVRLHCAVGEAIVTYIPSNTMKQTKKNTPDNRRNTSIQCTHACGIPYHSQHDPQKFILGVVLGQMSEVPAHEN